MGMKRGILLCMKEKALRKISGPNKEQLELGELSRSTRIQWIL